MNFNRKRHKTLQLLSVSRIQFDSGRTEKDFKLGVSFEDLQKELKCDLDTCELIYSTLYFEKEVEHTNTSVYGLFATQKGFTAYSDKKYIKENNKIILEYFKNFVQIVVPILSLIIALVAIIIKVDTLNRKTDIEIKTLNKELTLQKKEIGSLKQKIVLLNSKKQVVDEKD